MHSCSKKRKTDIVLALTDKEEDSLFEFNLTPLEKKLPINSRRLCCGGKKTTTILQI